MKKKYWIWIIVVLIAGFGCFEITRTRTKEITCSQTFSYANYPLNKQMFKKNANECNISSKLFQNDDALEFSVNGIRVKLTKERQRLMFHNNKPKETTIKKQLEHDGKLIKVLYKGVEDGSQMDIYAKFMFSYKGYFIRGSVRGIYRQEKKKSVKDVPGEVFTQTEKRILNFVDTYIA